MNTFFNRFNASYKYSSFIRLSLLLGVCIFLISCGKEKIDLEWIELNSGTAYTLTSVYFTDSNHGHAVGGDTWYRGIYLQTVDGGEQWQMDTLGNKQLFGLHFNQGQKGHAVGIDGYLFKKDEPEANWNFHKLPNWDILRDVCFNNEGNGVVVGGSAFKFGVIMTLGADYAPIAVDTFENELSAVCFSDNKTVHAVGYGIILRSTDSGLNWTISETNGDFYRSVHFPTSTTGYIAGYSGSILKTTDAGQTWKKLIDGDKIAVKNTPFRSVYFVNAEKGYLVGDKGTFWRTTDGGNNWQVIKNFPKVDLYDVYVIENKGYIVGENGRIFRFEE
jgi:photosystem II stability/assembly factor-like uncharacterized protein